MKKILVAISVMIFAFCMSGCGKKSDSSNINSAEILTETTTTDENNQMTPIDEHTESNEADSNNTTETNSLKPTESENKKPNQSSEEKKFGLNESGAVVFEEDHSTLSDAVLISAAQTLFESACTKEWLFTFDCPYILDNSDYIENEFGWRFSKITTAGITSFEDVSADYYKIFSDRYPNNELSSLYIEQNGAVYALAPARGSDLYYSHSVVTEITSKNDDEIFFTVENFYDATDFGVTETYSEKEPFSVVIDNDGVWYAGQFKLPY